MKKIADLAKMADIDIYSLNKNVSKTCESNAWLNIQKSKVKHIKTRKLSKCDFSTIRDSSKNGIFKNNSNTSSNSSGNETDISNNETESEPGVQDLSQNILLGIDENTSI
jgi:hypothetical protein